MATFAKLITRSLIDVTPSPPMSGGIHIVADQQPLRNDPSPISVASQKA